jgi:hypothetical protein
MIAKKKKRKSFLNFDLNAKLARMTLTKNNVPTA